MTLEDRHLDAIVDRFGDASRPLEEILRELVTPDYPAVAEAASEPDYATGRRWTNHTGTQQVIPERFYTPRSLAELQSIVRIAGRDGKTVRAIGSGHSYSDVAVSDHFMVDTSELRSPLALPPLRPGRVPDLYEHVEGGMKLTWLLAYLRAKGRTLNNLGGFTGQSVAGVTSTSTHGTGIQIGSLSHAVVSLVLVTESGTFRIEREGDGAITDEAKLDEPGVTLLRSDRHFYAALVGVGALGIVYSVILRTVASHYLSLTREVTTWDAVLPALKDRSIFRFPGSPSLWSRHVALWVNPHERGGRRQVVVSRADVDEGEPNGAPVAASPLDALMRTPIAQDLLVLVLNSHPQRMPELIDFVLRSQATGARPHVDWSDRILASSETVDGFACEVAFAMKSNRFLDAVNEVFSFATKQARDHNRYLSLVSLRFVQRSRAYLSPQYSADEHPVCMIEVPTPAKVRHAKELLKELTAALIGMGGRPHWGLDFDVLAGRDALYRLYPRFDDWYEVYRELNPSGTFGARFAARMGL